MKKNYEKPCCSSMVVAVEQAMLAGSPGAANENYNKKEETELNNSTVGGSNPAKINLFQFEEKSFCVVMFGLINVNILYYSFSTLYQMCNLRQSL